MPTPSEQKALAFLAMVVLLGGVVRVVRAGAPATASRMEQQALARQATAADSAATAASSSRAKPPRGGKGARPRKGGTSPTVVGGVASVPIGGGLPTGHDGFPPPSPRIDVDYRTGQIAGGVGAGAGVRGRTSPGALVDLDRASEPEIDALPRVGPTLARRLIANRDSFGAFGSIDALGRVKGFGPAIRKRIAPLVTFSGRPSSRP